jgi:hypothetical protein
MWRFSYLPWLAAVLAALLPAGPARALGDVVTIAPPVVAGPGEGIAWQLILPNMAVLLLGLSWVLLMRRQRRR